MSARSGLVGNKSSWPHLGPSEAIFSMDRKNTKNTKILPIFLAGPMGPIHPVWALAAIHPKWGNRYILPYFLLWANRQPLLTRFEVVGRPCSSPFLMGKQVAARALATYLIPGCVGRGVRLGSESSSGGGPGGVWKSGSFEIWGPGSP